MAPAQQREEAPGSHTSEFCSLPYLLTGKVQKAALEPALKQGQSLCLPLR